MVLILLATLSHKRDTLNDPFNEQAALQNVTRFHIPASVDFLIDLGMTPPLLSSCGQGSVGRDLIFNSTFPEYFIDFDV